jgi:hypothetical protein
MIEIGAADGWSGDNIESIDPDSKFERSLLFLLFGHALRCCEVLRIGRRRSLTLADKTVGNNVSDLHKQPACNDKGETHAKNVVSLKIYE